MISLALIGLALALGVVFVSAGVTKLANPSRAVAAIAAYNVASADSAKWLWLPLASLELLLGVALLCTDSRSRGAVAAAVLLCVYAFVIARAVRRGDTDFDCGCTASASRLRPSFALVVRNVGLATAAVLVALADARVPVSREWWTCIAFALFFLASNAMIGAVIARAQWPTDD